MKKDQRLQNETSLKIYFLKKARPLIGINFYIDFTQNSYNQKKKKLIVITFFIFQIYSWCRGWIASHCLGSLLLALPMLAVFTNFNCQVTHHHTDHYKEKNQRDFFLQLVFVSLAHFCNLSALNYCIKSMLATISAIVIVILFSTWSCDPCTHQEKPIMMANSEVSTVSTSRNLKKKNVFF